ncbi:hypothetical protein [Vibrio parahaemolyticus]|uniref:hypothetical protein n=1 Tax=Vibrio parahaemolyticus TaxID=670 RepID=UPI00111ED715
MIGDIQNRHYYWWTENNRRMRMIDLNKLNFNADKVVQIPLDENKTQDILEVTL